MNETCPPRPATLEPTGPCDHCGRPESQRFADGYICDACYIERGSCCAEGCDDDSETE
ncbi:MAG: hypothetical protein IPK32_04965 [Verrucomicrobiaceae bacterium]|nr:hypothetical protein [Verrucomicrobiaceae bacterium]